MNVPPDWDKVLPLETHDDLKLAIRTLEGRVEVQGRLLAPALFVLAGIPGPKALLLRAIDLITHDMAAADRIDDSPNTPVNERARDKMLEDLAVYRAAVERR